MTRLLSAAASVCLRRISYHGRNYSQPYFFKRNQSNDNRSHGFGAKFLLKKLSASDFSHERKSALKLPKGPIIFSVCGGEVNFEGGNRKKADLIKGGIKFGRNMVRGERNYEFVQGGIHFLIIRMYNKVLNGYSKPCYRICYQNNIMPNNCQCHIHFSVCSRFFVARASQAFLWYSQFSLNLNFDFLEIITS